MNICIVGGVAGGASCAARARRLDENAAITIFERGQFVSFANCGLPYHVGKVITDESDLLVATPELFRDRFNIDVRLGHEVTAIDRAARTITVHRRQEGVSDTVPYDALVLATGSSPISPPIPGLDLPGVFHLWTIPDSRRIMAWLDTRPVHRMLVVGGGFIGLEMVENFSHRNLAVTLVEMQSQVMPSLDPEMAAIAHAHLEANGVDLRLGTGVSALAPQDDSGAIRASLSDGSELVVDGVLMAAGVKANTELAVAAGLTVAPCGGIAVDAHMRTEDPAIWAVGDVVASPHVVTGDIVRLPLAGPANRQGRIAAAAICGHRGVSGGFRGVQGTSVCGLMGLAMAATGLSEKQLAARNAADGAIAWEKVYLHPEHHAGYYPGARAITIKLLFDPTGGRVLGAQAVGLEGVEKRIDVIAMAIQMGATVNDIAEAELCYAPQFGAAKDPVNLAGMLAVNAMDGLTPVAHWPDTAASGALVLDVRDPDEWAEGHVPGALLIPIDTLRQRLGELPVDREIRVHCAVGQRAHVTVRMLRQKGYRASNISGGFEMYGAFKAAGLLRTRP